MIESIKLKFGSGAGEPPLEFRPDKITIFVGPNNSGKSRLLGEIKDQYRDRVIMEEALFSDITDDEIYETFIRETPLTSREEVDEAYKNNASVFTKNGSGKLHIKYAFDALKKHQNLPQHSNNLPSFYLSSRTIFLDGKGRTNLIENQDMGDLQKDPVSSFQKLFQNNELRKKFREVIFQSLKYHVVIDPTLGGKLRLRLSPAPPPSDEIEKGLDTPSVTFHKEAQLLTEASDGAKAFVGILSEIMAGDPHLLIMDEPEAFLHPPLAFKLGLEIAKQLQQNAENKQMFAATHSPHFLMGCIQAAVPISIVRLTYHKNHATARILDNNQLSDLMKKPLLRSTGVMEGLFYESVIITEADSDRAFYQEINERLLEVGRGVPNCLFLNAQNKQTIPEIMAPLRKIGIPAAAICDIDFFKCGNSELNKYLKASHIPTAREDTIRMERKKIDEKLRQKNENYKTNGGINLLDEDDLAFSKEHITYWKDYGIFIIPHGELEAWLPDLNIPGHGSKWLVSAFEKMGDDPNTDGYVRPEQGDVWDFIDQIAEWLDNPNRRGIPP